MRNNAYHTLGHNYVCDWGSFSETSSSAALFLVMSGGVTMGEEVEIVEEGKEVEDQDGQVSAGYW